MAWVSTCVRSQGAGERSCSRDLVCALVNLDMFLFHYVSIEGEAPPPMGQQHSLIRNKL